MAESGYVRPEIDDPVFLDDNASPIQYGSRWAPGSPPDETYSVVTHPERFAPLLTVVEALVDFLARTYTCTVEEGSHIGREWRDSSSPEDGCTSELRAIMVAPQRPDAASLVFRITSFPGVWFEAGALFGQNHPDCGCDACDQEWSSCADGLEQNVFAVINGTFVESCKGRKYTVAIAYPNGGSRQSGRIADQPYSREYLQKARSVLKAQPGPWKPWPLRQPSM